jgi:hypothetical protein
MKEMGRGRDWLPVLRLWRMAMTMCNWNIVLDPQWKIIANMAAEMD